MTRHRRPRINNLQIQRKHLFNSLRTLRKILPKFEQRQADPVKREALHAKHEQMIAMMETLLTQIEQPIQTTEAQEWQER
jgi:hypothetical protein